MDCLRRCVQRNQQCASVMHDALRPRYPSVTTPASAASPRSLPQRSPGGSVGLHYKLIPLAQIRAEAVRQQELCNEAQKELQC